MTTRIPLPALALGLGGLLPFLAGTANLLAPGLLAGIDLPAPLDQGRPLLAAYGTIILCFMSGALWGFAARASGAWLALGLALSVLPAIYALFFVSGTGTRAMAMLLFAFAALLPLDALFQWRGLAPRWWLSLRLILTAVVCSCLALAAYA